MFSIKSFLAASATLVLTVPPVLAESFPFGFDLKKNPLEVYPSMEESLRSFRETRSFPKYCDLSKNRLDRQAGAIICNFGTDEFSTSEIEKSYTVSYEEGKGICSIMAEGRIVYKKTIKNNYGGYDVVEGSLGIPTNLAEKIHIQLKEKYGQPSSISQSYYDSNESLKGIVSKRFYWHTVPSSNKIESILITATNPDPDPEKKFIRYPSLNSGSIHILFTTTYC